MNRLVKIKPFGLFKIAKSTLESVERNVDNNIAPQDSIKNVIKEIKSGKPSQFFGVRGDKMELFPFIPIIENDQFFASFFPEPIQLYFSLAYSNYQFAIKSKNDITFQKNQRKDVPFNIVNSYLYNWHLKYKISTIIFLHSTIEAFINYIMPDDFIYKQIINGKKSDKFKVSTKEFDKEQTEKYINFKEKVSTVIPQLTNIDFQLNHKKIYDSIINLSTLRNNIIHLRSSTTEKNLKHFQIVFEEIINIDLIKYVLSVKDFINIIKPDYIEFEEVVNDDTDVFEFEFETFYAFKTDITVFLKILSVEAKKIVLKVPKSKDENLQFHLNWIFQNLDKMAEEQLIYFPEVNNDFEDRIEILITKTDNYIFEMKKNGSH